MKKLLVAVGIVCALVLGGIYSYSYAYVPATCSSVSGASVSGTYTTSGGYLVKLINRSGKRCSASYTLEGKTNNGTWEIVAETILTADSNNSSSHEYPASGYTNFRIRNVSTWVCD